MKRRSFFARVFGLAAASAVAPEAVKAVPVKRCPGWTLTPAADFLVEFPSLSDYTQITFSPKTVRCHEFNFQTGEWVTEHIGEVTGEATPLSGSRE